MPGPYPSDVPHTHLLVMAKYPTAGQVNTRLTPPLSPSDAATLHAASLHAVLERLGATGMDPVTLVGAPDDKLDAFRRLLATHSVDFVPQGAGTLGDRLIRAFARAFDDGANRVIALGADSPTLPSAFVTDAVERLNDCDAVLGPCWDGGYYLIGLSRPLPKLFERIDWGGSQVTQATKARAASAGVALVELPTWYDLDQCEDLVRAGRDLASASLDAQPWATALRALIQKLVARYPSPEPDDT